jgi:hypothetical protein
MYTELSDKKTNHRSNLDCPLCDLDQEITPVSRKVNGCSWWGYAWKLAQSIDFCTI